MNTKAKSIIENLSFTITSNFASLLISTLVVIVVPKLVGVTEYGYWQLYLFYSSYVGFMHFGWNDGIYLRYGGYKYEDLEKSSLFSQFYLLLSLQILVALIISIVAGYVSIDEDRLFISRMIAVSLVLVNLRAMLLFILQATNRLKESAKVTILGQVLYFGVVIVCLALGGREFKIIVVSDLLGKAVSLFYAMYCTRDIVFRKISEFFFSAHEVIENIRVGSRLMLANIASTLIIGTVRFGISRAWDVDTFGKVSLSLSISNLLMIFINAVGVVLFPLLRRTGQQRLAKSYVTLRELLMVLLLGVLVIFFPLRVVLSAWLPQYYDSLLFMALVFPTSVYEGKKALLINTYLKAMRQEKLLFRINLVALTMSVFVTFLSTVVFRNLELAMFSIVLVMAFRAILAELYLSQLLDVSLVREILLESVVVIVFILAGWLFDSWISMAVYLGVYALYLAVKSRDIANAGRDLMKLLRM